MFNIKEKGRCFGYRQPASLKNLKTENPKNLKSKHAYKK
jgi:hypothetical protein